MKKKKQKTKKNYCEYPRIWIKRSGCETMRVLSFFFLFFDKKWEYSIWRQKVSKKPDPFIRNILDTTNQTVDQTGKNKIHWHGVMSNSGSNLVWNAIQ